MVQARKILYWYGKKTGKRHPCYTSLVKGWKDIVLDHSFRELWWAWKRALKSYCAKMKQKLQWRHHDAADTSIVALLSWKAVGVECGWQRGVMCVSEQRIWRVGVTQDLWNADDSRMSSRHHRWNHRSWCLLWWVFIILWSDHSLLCFYPSFLEMGRFKLLFYDKL